MFSYPLFFLRHGETFYNAEGRIQGQLDTPLSPRGRGQAGEAGRILADAIRADGRTFDAFGWIASPLTRAVDTMMLARAAAGLPETGFSCDPRLMELSFGRWQNLTWPEIRAKYPREAAQRDAGVWTFTPPDGESYAALAERVGAWLSTLSGPTVAVAHGGVARALMTLIGGVSPSDAYSLPVQQGRVLAFSDGHGRWI